jgi:transposase-like protein
MRLRCPSKAIGCLEFDKVVRFGTYYRRSDRKRIQRYKCAHCKCQFSQATSSMCYGQNKRHLNSKIMKLLVSGVSQRRIARILNVHKITVSRKLKFLGLIARQNNFKFRQRMQNVTEMQFDDLETFEHTKLKPLSVTLAVQKHTRYILGFEVARMSAKGLLANKSLKKYGPRKDERFESRNRLFRRLKNHVANGALIESDENPHYTNDVKMHFPTCVHQTIKGQRGCITGQGELKKIKYDPLFSLNHTCAMFRANINRLFRKTWCTTKKIQPLIDHIEIYTYYHNQYLIK